MHAVESRAAALSNTAGLNEEIFDAFVSGASEEARRLSGLHTTAL
jgi:hypothetical protein